MAWRINALAALLSLATGTPWMTYYVVALHTLHFGLVFLFGWLGGFRGVSGGDGGGSSSSSSSSSSSNSRALQHSWPVLVKLAVFLAALAAVWDRRVYGSTVNEVLQALLGRAFAAQFWYRTDLDRFSSWPGVVVGFFWPSLLSVFGFAVAASSGGSGGSGSGGSGGSGSGGSGCTAGARHGGGGGSGQRQQAPRVAVPPPVRARAGVRAALIFVSALLLASASYLCADMLHAPARWREYHPYAGLLWVPAYALCRNASAALRSHVLAPLEFLGAYSLELYLLQFHLLMGRSASRVLVLVPGYPTTNLALVFAVYACAAMRCHELTAYLRAVVFGAAGARRAWGAAAAALALGLNHAAARMGSAPRTQIGSAAVIGAALYGALRLLLAADSALHAQRARRNTLSAGTKREVVPSASISAIVPFVAGGGREVVDSATEPPTADAEGGGGARRVAQQHQARGGQWYVAALLVAAAAAVPLLAALHAQWPDGSSSGTVQQLVHFSANGTVYSNTTTARARAKATQMRTFLESYYGGSARALLHSVSLRPGDARYDAGLEFIAHKMARAIVHGDTFVVGTMGSSVTAAHDNCNYDSYQRQLERFLGPMWASVGAKLEVRNAGQGGGCGDSYANQPFCVRHILGDDVDIVHYSWTYFEEEERDGDPTDWRENLLRWSLLMDRSPAMHILNVGNKKTDAQCAAAFGPPSFYDTYGKYGMNAVCLQTGLFTTVGSVGNAVSEGMHTWNKVGDGFGHHTTRYGEGADVSAARRKSLGEVYRNWHPGPLGFQVVADAFAYYYLHAMLKALDLIEAAGRAAPGQPLGTHWPKVPRLLLPAELPPPHSCDPAVCDLPEPPGCNYFEHPAYGKPQIGVVPPEHDPQNPTFDNSTSGWTRWKAAPSRWIPREEQATMPTKQCAHLDFCGSVKPTAPKPGWLTFQLPAKMTQGTIIVCCCCAKDCALETFGTSALTFVLDGHVLDRSKFAVYPNPKCMRLQSKFQQAVQSAHGHLYLSMRYTGALPKYGVSHVIAF